MYHFNVAWKKKFTYLETQCTLNNFQNSIILGRVLWPQDKNYFVLKFPFDISIRHYKSQDPNQQNWKFGFGTGLKNFIEESDW